MSRATWTALALIVALLAACSDEKPQSVAPGPMPTGPVTSARQYVALGDSYVAGPDLAPKAKGDGPCERSSVDYPAVLAKAIGADELVDVSCPGASSDNVVNSHPISVGGRPSVLKAQVDALDDSTDLVTLGIGGNDQSVFGGLYTSCTDSYDAEHDSCQTFVDDTLPTILESVRANATNVLTAIRQRAPHAVVVLVTYPPVVGDDQGCAALGITGERATLAAKGGALLDRALQSSAQDAGTDVVSMLGPGRSHGACSAEPWINGLKPADGAGAALHPTKAGMAGVARAVRQHLAAR